MDYSGCSSPYKGFGCPDRHIVIIALPHCLLHSHRACPRRLFCWGFFISMQPKCSISPPLQPSSYRTLILVSKPNTQQGCRMCERLHLSQLPHRADILRRAAINNLHLQATATAFGSQPLNDGSRWHASKAGHHGKSHCL